MARTSRRAAPGWGMKALTAFLLFVSTSVSAQAPAQAAYGYLTDVVGISRRARSDGRIDYGRIAGSPYDAMAADYVEAAFNRFGLSNVRQERFQTLEPVWTLDTVELTVRSQDAVVRLTSAFTPYFARTTGPGGVDAEVVDLGDGSGSLVGVDLEGKIVLVHAYVEGIAFGNQAQAAATRLAAQGRVAGIVIAIHQPGDPQTRYATPGGPTSTSLESVPWVNVSGADGALLADMIASSGGAPVRAHLTLEATVDRDRTTQNTIGVLPGRSPRAFLFLAHTDSHFEGATDNASGVSVLLALAQEFASRRDLDRTLVFVATGGHHNGPAGGVRTAIAQHPDLVERLDMVVNLEHFGSLDPDADGSISDEVGITNLFVPAQNPAIVETIRAAAARNGVALEGEVRPYWSADYAPFLNVGTPAVMLMQPTPWYHTEADRLEVISPDALLAIQRTYVDFIEAMDEMTTERIAEGTPTRDLLRDLLARQRAGAAR